MRTLLSYAAAGAVVPETVVIPYTGTTGGPAKIIAGVNGCMDLPRTRMSASMAAATFRIGPIMKRG
jgi:hypothetical protein